MYRYKIVIKNSWLDYKRRIPRSDLLIIADNGFSLPLVHHYWAVLSWDA
jgi:hypothetical protein